MTIPTLAVCILLAIHLSSPSKFSTINFAWAADAYGNDIRWIAIYQKDGASWVLRGNITASSGQSVRVHDNQWTVFNCSIMFNSTYASSQGEAISYTRVYMNISNGGAQWTNEELNNTVCTGPTGNFFYLIETGNWTDSGYPQAGTTYECNATYQGYF